jgi:hypothetical protein
MNSDEYEFYIIASITVFCAVIIIIMHAINHIVKVNTRHLRNDIAALRLQSSLDHDERNLGGAGHPWKQRIRASNVAQKVEARGDALYVWAWCDRDQALRQFRVARMTTLVHESGETSEAVDLAMWLAKRGTRGTDLKE